MHSGCEAWLMLVQPSSHVVVMKDDTCAAAGEGSAGTAEPSHWENVVAECADVFELPGMPAEWDTTPGMFNGKLRAGNSREISVSRERGGKSLSLGNS